MGVGVSLDHIVIRRCGWFRVVKDKPGDRYKVPGVGYLRGGFLYKGAHQKTVSLTHYRSSRARVLGGETGGVAVTLIWRHLGETREEAYA
jgi:hypothetical protein